MRLNNSRQRLRTKLRKIYSSNKAASESSTSQKSYKKKKRISKNELNHIKNKALCKFCEFNYLGLVDGSNKEMWSKDHIQNDSLYEDKIKNKGK